MVQVVIQVQDLIGVEVIVETVVVEMVVVVEIKFTIFKY